MADEIEALAEELLNEYEQAGRDPTITVAGEIIDRPDWPYGRVGTTSMMRACIRMWSLRVERLREVA